MTPMLQTMRGAALLLTVCSVSVFAGWPVQNVSIETGRLNSRIGPANPQRYRSIHDAKDWANPYLVIRPEVISKDLPSGSLMGVPATDLRRTLISLPVTAWPYGRVVAVSDVGIREADLSDEKALTDTRNSALATLKTLQVTVERWPA